MLDSLRTESTVKALKSMALEAFRERLLALCGMTAIPPEVPTRCAQSQGYSDGDTGQNGESHLRRTIGLVDSSLLGVVCPNLFTLSKFCNPSVSIHVPHRFMTHGLGVGL